MTAKQIAYARAVIQVAREHKLNPRQVWKFCIAFDLVPR